MTRTNIPQIDSIQELAQFWDTHDLTDFDNELEEMAHKYNCVKWLRFWHACHAHFVPAFRGFMLPGLNLAEPGQGAMDRQTTHILFLLIVHIRT